MNIDHFFGTFKHINCDENPGQTKGCVATLQKQIVFSLFFWFSAGWATRSTKAIPNCNLPHNTIPMAHPMVFPLFFHGFSIVFPLENPILPMSFFRRRDTKGAGVQGRHAAHVRRDQITQVVPGRPEHYLPWRENCNSH